jgi:nitronate monooxygenase
MQRETNAKAWKDIWSAGQGVGAIQRIESTEEIIIDLQEEYKEALTKVNTQANKLNTYYVK